MSGAKSYLQHLGSAEWSRIEQVLQGFEAAWQSGSQPAVEDFLPPGESGNVPLLAELVHLDLEYRLKAGTAVRVELYLERFPGLAHTTPAVLDLLAWEYALRQRTDPTLAVEEYIVRFPHLATELAARLREGLPPQPTLDISTGNEPSTAQPGDSQRAGGPAGMSSEPRYQGLRLHAAGALGEVFVAQDTVLHREVALKRIQARYRKHAESRTRFLREAEVTGRLEHPGIVPVHDLQYDADGQPCYVMRFVEGETLKQAIERYHAAPGRLAFRQLLGHFVAACNAVAYAHSRGVLHRDLKPANILLGKFGETLVVDWGLAKVAGATSAVGTDAAGAGTTGDELAEEGTALGNAMGTPAYMAPEQAAGRWDVVGPASDVYGLGATLYHLLTGRPPFEGTNIREVLARVQRGVLTPPRQMRREVPPALDAICHKALALEPAERYATAQALAADVEHWLADEAVTAYREPWPARAGRWARRHPAVVAAAAALLLTASVASWVGTVLIGQRERAAQAARARADSNFELAREAVEQTVTKVAVAPGLKRGDFHALRKELLASAVPFYEHFVQQRSDDPELEAKRGWAYQRLAFVRAQIGEREAALADYEQMGAIFARLAASFPAVPQYRQHLATSHNNLGLLLKDLGRQPEAEAEYRRAITFQQKLAADFPSVPEYRRDLARSHNNLGIVLSSQGDGPGGEAAYRQALALQEGLAADFPAVPEYRHELARSHNNLGLLLKDLGRQPEAEAECRRALALQERLAASFRGVPEYRHVLASSHKNLGNLLQIRGEWAHAEAAYRQAIALQGQLAADFPAVPEYRQELAGSHTNLGALLTSMSKMPAAEAQCRRAISLQERLAADFPTVPEYRHELARSHNTWGNLLDDLGQRQEAEAAYRRAITLWEQLAANFPNVPAYAVDLGGGYCNYGNLLSGRGEAAASLVMYSKAVATLRPVLDREPRLGTARLFLRNAHASRAMALGRLGRHAEALADWNQALVLNDERSPEGRLRLWRAASLARAGQHTEATAAVEGVLKPGNADSLTLYNAACVYALAAAQTAKQAAPPHTSSLRAEQYARRAVDLLRQALQKGYKHVAHLKKDSDLDALRQREDFRQLLAELDAQPAGK
jgi:serine/threonine-protein kinase